MILKSRESSQRHACTTLSVTNHMLLEPNVIVLNVTPGATSMRAETGFIDSGFISLPLGS